MPQGALGGSSGRTTGRPARALVGQLLRVGVAVFIGARLWGHSCSRLGTARRCEPPPAPRVPTLGKRGAQHPCSGRGPRGRLKERMLLADWGSAGTMRHAGRTVGQAVRRHVIPRKNIWDGGGSHRRSRAVSTAALRDVATETPLTPAPVRVRFSQGKEQLPHTL